MTDYGLRKPDNAIIERGQPMWIDRVVETATTMKPGRLVMKGTTNADVVVNTGYLAADSRPCGWLGYEQAHPSVIANASGLNNSVDGTYAALDIAPILFGGGFIIVASLTSTQQAYLGDAMMPAASGEVRTWIAGQSVVAIAMEDKYTVAGGEDIMVLSLL